MNDRPSSIETFVRSFLVDRDLSSLYLISALLVGVVLVLVIFRKLMKRGAGARSEMNIDLGFLDKVSDKGKLTKEEMRKVRDSMVRQALNEKGLTSSGGVTVQDLSAIAVNPEGLAEIRGGRAASQGPPLPPPLPSVARGEHPRRPSRREADVVPPLPGTRDKEPSAGQTSTLADLIVPASDLAGPPRVDLNVRPKGRSIIGNIEVDPPAEPVAKEETPEPEARDSRSEREESEPWSEGGGDVNIDQLYLKGLIGREEYKRLRDLAKQARRGES